MEKRGKKVNDRLFQNKKGGEGGLAQNLNSYKNDVAEVCEKRILRKFLYKQSKLRLEWI